MEKSVQYRLFIAIEVPEAIKDEIEKAQLELRGLASAALVRWSRRSQFHLTLKFLGNVASGRVESLVAAIGSACGNFGPLHLRAGGVGFFPNARFPRVVWAGVSDAMNLLSPLQQALEKAVREFTSERSDTGFSGHITLGRIRRMNHKEPGLWQKHAAGLAGRVFGDWISREVELIRSELDSEGPRYSALAKISLASQPGPTGDNFSNE